MDGPAKHSPYRLCAAVFALCLFVRFIEYFLLETDRTAIGERMLRRILWVELGDHLLNNTVATNMLHVVSQEGADELQIVRIFAAQLISFAIVLILYRRKAKAILT